MIFEQENEGRLFKVQTEKGLALGIKTIEKVSERGNAYTQLLYPENVQKMIVNHLVELGKTMEI